MHLTNDELAELLSRQQIDRTIINEAADRLRKTGLEQMLVSIEAVDAINSSPLIDKHMAKVIEPLILAPSIRRQSNSRMSSLAARIMAGADYTHGDVLSLAASVVSQDETRGQS